MSYEDRDENQGWIEEYDAHSRDPESLSKEALIRITQAMRARIDELSGTQRSPEGEEAVKDDTVVEDDEEYMR